MKKYLCLSREKTKSADSQKKVTTRAIPRIRHQKNAYSSPVKTETLSLKKSHLIIGADNAGKSRWISKLRKEANVIWRNRPVLALRSVDAVTDWVAQLPRDFRNAHDAPKTMTERIELMREYVRGGVLLVDDVHRLQGRKVDYMHELISDARYVIASATSTQKIHPKVRHTLMSREPVIHELQSGTAYDATHAIVWILVVVLMVAGMGEMSVILAGANLLTRGAKTRGQV